MKDFPITIGFDDAKFNLNSNTKTTDLIGVICQGTRMVGMVKKKIYIDGDDATEALIDLTKQNEKHVQYILSDSITFGGFNIIDLDKVYGITKKPIIAVTERLVNLEAVRKAVVKKFPNKYGQKLQNIVNAGELYETSIETAGGFSKVYFHSKGIQFSEVDSLLRKICIDSKTPEPVRLAHIVGKAI